MSVGGQAVLEGVLMMDAKKYAVAVRTPAGDIKTMSKKKKTHKLSKIPFIRGIISLFDMVVIGSNALTWSAEQQGEEPMKKSELIITFGGAILMTVGIFILAPYFLAKLFFEPPTLLFNLLDGLFRLIALFSYLIIIGLMKDIRRLYEYHGAEHKTVHCYEAKKELTVENIKNFPKEHARCGTSLLVYVFGVSILLFSLVHTSNFWVNISARILLIPVIASLSYELLKLAANFKWMSWATLPGIWTQKLTTKEPSADQIEVAIVSLKEVVE